MTHTQRLQGDQLYRRCDPDQFTFETTSDLETIESVVGQPRAVAAMEFGVGMGRDGYNIFALGPTGLGKRVVVRRFFEQRAETAETPSDWCYVNNFDEPHKPKAIRLPPGKGAAFRQDMRKLVEEIGASLRAAFESEEYQAHSQAIAEELQERQSDAFEELRKRAQERDIALIRTPSGLAVAPTRDGEVLSPQEVQELSEEERQRLQESVEEIQSEIQKVVRQAPAWQRDIQERIKQLDREMAGLAVGGLFDELSVGYADFPAVVEYLETVQKDVIENAQVFTADESESPLMSLLQGSAMEGGSAESPALRRYHVNLLIDHGESEGAPVVYEDNPTYQNLVGRVEHIARMGALTTDFNLIKPGALHRANGGYLIIDAYKLLAQPYAWDGLKRALKSGRIHIESIGQWLSLVSTVSLEPHPIPLDVKVALLGERMLYYLLWQLDPEFADLFKVEVDFEEDMARGEGNEQVYAQLIASLARQETLRPFDRTAVARLIERSARLAGDTAKLTTSVRHVTELLREADYWAGKADNDIVTASDVQRAIDAQIYRADRLRERAHEAILRETILIDTEGAHVGQVNGLSVTMLGNYGFGRPARITARVHMGKGQVVDIEREVDLGGPIHSKGVLILSGFLNARYAEERPLSLSATLVFEQSYGGVEGDSASSAELYALLSAISGVPIRQSLAVTGSVNQHGQIQPIGGVNEKIEGFFDICRARGLTGEQGVLIPAANVKHLMLRQDVIDAVDAGQFHIYSVEVVDEGIEILTGVPAGERDEAGDYPEGSINHLVDRRLAEMAEKRRRFSAVAREEQT